MAPNTMRRTVSDEWTAYGDTEVLHSFARLTPEKGKSVGALWSNFPVGDAAASDRLSVVLKFRISGRAPAEQRGEGVALCTVFAATWWLRMLFDRPVPSRLFMSSIWFVMESSLVVFVV
jgi:hypothetical protein